jgi:eukaryotic-like serine/threonine-protein kinase
METLGELVAGRYRLLERLGAGGMGGVWLAHDEADDEPVAIKKCALPAGLTSDEQDLFRVWTVREARAYSIVGHPNVVRTLDVLPDDEAPWIVMEYVESRSLQEIIDESGPLPPARVAGIGLAVLEALLAVRRAELLHLDVKPGNVLIAQDGRVVLTDFGPAVTTEGVRALAGAGIILGSPKYLAPERLTGGVARPESDLWSLGATLYHAVEGRPPFARPTTAATLLALSEGPPDPIERAGPLAPLLAALLHVDPAARPPADVVGDVLRAVIQQPLDAPAPMPRELAAGSSVQAPAVRSRRRGRVAAIAGALALLIAVVTVSVVARPGEQSEAKPAAVAAVPDGFVPYTGGDGYQILIPAWPNARVDPAGSITTTGPDGGWPVLSITYGTVPPDNLVAELTRDEARFDKVGYRRIRIEQPPSAPAYWDYTYSDPAAGPIRSMRRVFVDSRDHRTINVDWTAPRDSWAENLPVFDQITASFRLVPGG